MIGSHLSEFMNSADFVELANAIYDTKPATGKHPFGADEHRAVFRVKSLVSPRGRSVTLRQAFEKVSFSLLHPVDCWKLGQANNPYFKQIILTLLIFTNNN